MLRMADEFSEFYYTKLAKKAIEKNIGFFVRRMARAGELRGVMRGNKLKTSKYKGVCYDIANSTSKPWRAAYRRKNLGSFQSEELAHKAYQLAVSKDPRYKKKKKRMRIAA